MWERLDSVQLESDEANYNNLKKKHLKYKKKKHVDTCQQTPFPHVIRGEQSLLYIYRYTERIIHLRFSFLVLQNPTSL